VSLLEAIELAKNLGEKNIPSDIVIIGIVLKEIPYEFGETLSPNIAASVPKAVEVALNEIKNNLNYSS
jgi:Ni,Fe-hydrogenase maturation factor